MNLHHRHDFLTYTAVFLLVLLGITMGLAAWGDVTPWQTIRFDFGDIGIGIMAALLMMAAFGLVSPVRDQAEEILGPSLAACRWYDLIPVAILVGFIEELLFRGVLEPWAARLSPWGAFIGVNVVFGLLHAVSWPYAIVAGLLGAILSLLARGPGEYNLLRPIVAHAVYDYIGFIWISLSYRRSRAAGETGVSEPAADSDDDLIP